MLGLLDTSRNAMMERNAHKSKMPNLFFQSIRVTERGENCVPIVVPCFLCTVILLLPSQHLVVTIVVDHCNSGANAQGFQLIDFTSGGWKLSTESLGF